MILLHLNYCARNVCNYHHICDKGICGHPCVMDIGGMSYLLPLPNMEKVTVVNVVIPFFVS